MDVKSYFYSAFLYLALMLMVYGMYSWKISDYDTFTDRIRNRLPRIYHTEFISLFRILHSVLVLILAVQLIELVPFTHFGVTGEGLSIYYVLHYVWIVNTILILAGTRFRLFYITNGLLTYLLLGSNIGDFMLKMASFWMIFLMPVGHFTLNVEWLKIAGLDRKPVGHSHSWAVYLMGLNLAFLITIAGIFKALDPVWLHGLGFYYTYLQPWIYVPWTGFVLDMEWLNYLMNYLGIIFEASAFFLFLFNRTRIAGMFVMFAFLMLVTFPLRIDPVGPAGLVILVGLLSLFNFKNLPSLAAVPERNEEMQSGSVVINNFLFWVAGFILLSQIAIGGLGNHQRFTYPFVEAPFQYSHESIGSDVDVQVSSLFSVPGDQDAFSQVDNESSSGALKPHQYVTRPLYQGVSYLSLYRDWPIIGYFSIFGFNHSFARGYYNIESDGAAGKHELIKAFDEEGRVPSGGDRNGFMRPLNLHVVYGQLGIMYHRIARNGFQAGVNASDQILLESLFNFSSIRYAKLNGVDAMESEIYINPIQVPYEFVGKFDNTPDEWQLIIGYDHESKQMRLIKGPDTEFDFSKVDIPLFKNGHIIFSP